MAPVLLINPNTSEASTALMAGILRAALGPAPPLVTETARVGAPMLTTPQDLDTAAQEVLRIGRARAPAVSAIVVGAFGNPGLGALRAAVDIPVLGIGEAALREAAAGGRRFGVATTTPGLDTSIGAAARALGLDAGYTGTRVPAADPLALAQDPDRQDACLAELIAACVADGAEAVVIGGGPLAASAARLAPRFPVPVIDAVAAAGRALRRLPALAGPA